MQSYRRYFIPFCLGGILSSAVINVSRAVESVTVEVAAGDIDRERVPVGGLLPASLKTHENFTLTRADTGKPIPVISARFAPLPPSSSF